MASDLSRRGLLRYGAAAMLGRRAAAAPRPGAPNVLFLISDDLDCRLGCYGDPVARTPAIDGLAARGVRFHRAYCQFPLCNPTRSSVLSGRYPTSTGVFDNNTLLVLDEGQYTLPRYFERNGYTVAEFGKIHHAFNRGFNRGEPKPPKSDAWFTPDERRRQQAENPAYWDNTHSPYRNLRLSTPSQYAWANEFGPLPEGDPGGDHQIATRALQSLEKLAAGSRPFFLAVGFHKPHVPLKVPKQFFDLYDPARMPLPPDFDTEPRQIPGYPTDEFRQNIDLFAARSFSSLEAREAMRAYYACISYLDAQIARLLEGLARHGVRDNTIVVLWGDHGWHLSEKGMWAKGTLFEVSARGPLIVADPRRPGAGKSSPRVVQYLDIYPTLVDLCGLPTPAHLEGSSLRTLLDDPAARWDHPAYTVQVRNWFLGRSVRTERWRYTEWDEGRRGAALFDHDNDPGEMRNLAAEPAREAIVRELQRLLRQGPVASDGPR